MNIVIGKFGRSISFNEEKWGAVGGDNEPAIFFKKIAEYNPTINFYMIGMSDIESVDNLPNNIINIWKDYNKNICERWEWPLKYLKNIKVDAGIIMSGPMGNVNIPEKSLKIDGSGTAKVLTMFKNYSAPINNYLNESKIPYIVITPDPRYIGMGRDTLNAPIMSLSQINKDYKYRRIESFENQKKSAFKNETIRCRYAGIEQIFLIDKEKPVINFDKKTKMCIILNQGGGGNVDSAVKSRELELKRFILNQFENIDIIGKWDEKFYKDKRFKGSIPFSKLQKDILPYIKYTFLIPIDKGWATAKFWEMIYFGIIPFMHPYYDIQKNIKCPDYIRVKSSTELKNKIEELENDKELYNKILNDLLSMITPERLSGLHINNIVMKVIYKILGYNTEDYNNV